MGYEIIMLLSRLVQEGYIFPCAFGPTDWK